MRRAVIWRTCLLSASLCICTFAASAPGQSTIAETRPLHLEYTAPTACPQHEDFEARVRGRTSRASFGAGPEAQAARVTVRSNGARYVGHMSLVADSGLTRERDVEGDHCDQVVDALALVTALAIDPNASFIPSAAPFHTLARSAGAMAKAEAAPVPSAGATGPSESLLDPLSHFPQATARDGLAERGTAASAPSVPAWAGSIGVSLFTLTGAAPDALAGAGAHAELACGARGRLLCPSGRISALGGVNGAFASRSASFLFGAARADGCPLRLGTEAISFRPCGAADVGLLRAQGLDIAHPVVAERLWNSLAALARGRWEPQSSRGFVEIEAGLAAPLLRPSFVYQTPAVVVHQTPGAVVLASATAGWRFR